MRAVGPIIAAGLCLAGLSGCIEAHSGRGERYIAAPYRADASQPSPVATTIADGGSYVPSPAATVEMPTATW